MHKYIVVFFLSFLVLLPATTQARVIGLSVPFSSLTDAAAANVLQNNGFKQTWLWDSLKNETALQLQTSNLANGNLFSLALGANDSKFSGNILQITSTADGAGQAGDAININLKGIQASTTGLHIVNEGTAGAYSLKVEDELNDTTPVVIDATGKVGIGTAIPSAELDLRGNFLASGHIALGNAGAIDPVVSGFQLLAPLVVQEKFGNFPITGNNGIYSQFNNLDISSQSAPAGYNFVAGQKNVVNILDGHTSEITYISGGDFRINRVAGASGNMRLGPVGVSGSVLLSGSGKMSIYPNIESGVKGGFFTANVSGGNEAVNVVGVIGNGWVDDVAKVDNVYGVYAKASNHNTAGPVVGNLVAVQADLDVPRHTGTAIGLRVISSNGEAASESYGVRVDSLSSPVGQAWGIYVNGAWNNYFGGNVGIGTATPEEKLVIKGNVKIIEGKLCLAEVCVTKEQLQSLLNLLGQ